MLWKILYRMILWELVKVFALSLFGIMTILVMAGIVAEATQQGMKPSQILPAIPLLVPSFLPYTIPATTLFAACVVYGRLAADNEILAIKAAGINILKVLWPGIVMGLAMSLITVGLYYQFIPYTHHLLRAHVMNDIEEYMYDMLRRDKCIRQPKLPYVMWVRQVQGTHLQDALFKRIDRTGHYDVIARSRDAELQFDMAKHQVLVRMRDGEVMDENGTKNSYFQQYTWPVPLPPDFGIEPRPKPRDLSWPGILQEEQDIAEEEGRLAEKIEHEKELQKRNLPAPELRDHVNQLKQCKWDVQCLNAELHMRPALSFGCLCFVMIGCPVGVWFSKSDYLSAFITCFLPVVFVYYPLMLCSTNYAKQGYPGAVLWISNGLVALIGLWLFRQLMKH